MSKWIARAAMVASLSYYTLTTGIFLVAGFSGNASEFWNFLELPTNLPLPPLWTYFCGIFMSFTALGGLAFAYWSVEKILHGDSQKDFLLLSRLLRGISIGLLVFWFGYNLITSLMPVLFLLHLPAYQPPAWEWDDPLDIDIVFVILAIALFAISQALKRAWAIEDENRHFL